MNICLFGAASALIDSDYMAAVEELGELMAKKGYTMVYGGGSTGLMGAAARGMSKVPGRNIIGIAPEFFGNEVLYRKCNEMIYTKTMRERKTLMEEKSDAFIMVPGGVGTFEEFFEVLTLNQLKQVRKPIAVYNINGYFNDLYELIEKMVKENFVEPSILRMFTLYENAEEMLAELEDQLSQDTDLNQ